VREKRPRVPWEEWAFGVGLALLVVGLVGAPLSLLLGAGVLLRASLVAAVIPLVLWRLVGAFGRSYPEESSVDRMMRRFRRELKRDLKRLR
jgi:hypothetical protein